MNKQYIVYCHINKINNKKYIGITKNIKNRWRANGAGYYNYKKDSQHQSYFYNAIQKYGWDNFQHIILLKNLTFEEACQYQKKYIKDLNLQDEKYGYNMTSGGEGTPNRIVTDETKEKLSQANLGKKLSVQTKEKISQSLQDRYFTEQHKKKLQENHHKNKQVLCIETNIIYPSCQEAARQLGKIKRGQGSFIAEAARGKSKTAYGFHWKYIAQKIQQEDGA